MSDELKTLLPDEIYTLETGGQVTVRPVPFGKLNIFHEAAASLMLKISGLGLELKDIRNWKTLFDVAFEEVLNIMALVLEKPREWFDTISINDGIGLLAVIVEQNFRDETKKNILKVVEKLGSIQQTSSRYSSRQDTVGKRSRTTR